MLFDVPTTRLLVPICVGKQKKPDARYGFIVLETTGLALDLSVVRSAGRPCFESSRMVAFSYHKASRPYLCRKTKKARHEAWLYCFGDDGTRTRHLKIANLPLYQMSYVPKMT